MHKSRLVHVFHDEKQVSHDYRSLMLGKRKLGVGYGIIKLSARTVLKYLKRGKIMFSSVQFVKGKHSSNKSFVYQVHFGRVLVNIKQFNNI